MRTGPIHILTADNFLDLKFSWMIFLSTTSSSLSYIFSALFARMIKRSVLSVMKEKLTIVLITILTLQFILINYFGVMVDVGTSVHQILQLMIVYHFLV